MYFVNVNLLILAEATRWNSITLLQIYDASTYQGAISASAIYHFHKLPHAISEAYPIALHSALLWRK